MARVLYGSTAGVLKCLGMPSDTTRLPSAFDTVGGIDGIDELRAQHSDWVDSKVPGNAIPFDPVPEQADRVVNMRTACDMVAHAGVSGYEMLIDREKDAILDFLSFAKGVPIRTASPRTNLAVSGSAATSSATDRGTIP